MSSKKRHASSQEDLEGLEDRRRQGSMATTYLPPINPHGFAPPPPQVAQQPYHRDPFVPAHTPRHSPETRYRSPLTQAAGPAYLPTQANISPRPFAERRPGVLPLSSLLQPEPTPPLTSQSSSTAASPTVSMQLSHSVILSPAQLSEDGRATPAPIARRVYFDPARDQNARIPSPRSQLEQERAESERRQRAEADLETRFGPQAEYGQSSGAFDKRRFQLEILQQPIAARACGTGEKDRRLVDPPPILRLTLKDYDPDSEEDVNNLKAQLNLVHCSLHELGPGDSCGADISAQKDSTGDDKRKLMGSLACSPFIGIDRNVPESASKNVRLGVYYLFHDLSCRQPGKYRLQFRLIPIDFSAIQATGVAAPIGDPVTSSIFEVFGAKDYPGVRESTPLTKELKSQGATVSIKKGSDRRVQSTRQKGRRASSASSAGSQLKAQQD